ncbi:FAD-dependent oxidoreductase [Cyanobacterium sp. Dongsha4]|uniref:NAD(P)/FAD-dependent oxidoreductase n=1 Tax=Cyanobacterium sp. DS4 TaxID=2878255 RepID=UPI002E8221CA|nr:FAD-dependent oxidoreductase [Cyanobacterium sp. Dongsha4]WVL00034.1 FAD-binding oxidoreductase [Cyanobacterium sp. Dongsha4]
MKKIIIVGSGIVGSAIAYELSNNSEFDITLIDEKNPGTGATGAALGILMAIISLKTKGRAWKLRELSLKRYKTLISELENFTGLSIPHNSQGIVKLLFTEDELQRYGKLAQFRASQGYKLDIWDQSLLKFHCPEIDTSSIVGAVYSPDDWQVSPTFLTKALVKGASMKGVKCIFGEKVKGLNICSENHTEVILENQSLSADIVIIATGLGTSSLLESLHIPIEIKPVLGQALLVKYDQWQSKDGFNPVITGNDIHIAPMGNHEFWLGATVEFPDSQGKVIAKDQLLKNLRSDAIAFCPSLAQAPIMLSWTGKRPRPEGKSAPIIEKLEPYNNIILATGHYRNGVLLAPATASIIKDMIT